MANVNAPFGLRPVANAYGAPYSGGVNEYAVASDYGTALFIGDPVYRTGESVATDGTPYVGKAAAGDTPSPGNPITGVIVGFRPNPNNLNLQYLPANTGGYVLVADDPGMLCQIQADGTITEDQIGLNANLIYSVAGSTVTGLSGAQLDTTSDVPAADASNQLTITRLYNASSNAFGAHAVVMVRINQSTETPNTLGV